MSSYSHFCSKNINVFENTLATTVKKFVINKLVKLKLLWTAVPRMSYLIWAATWQTYLLSFTQWRLKSAKYRRSLCCPHVETLQLWLSIMHREDSDQMAKCAGWSESSLGAYVQRYISDAMNQYGLQSLGCCFSFGWVPTIYAFMEKSEQYVSRYSSYSEC